MARPVHQQDRGETRDHSQDSSLLHENVQGVRRAEQPGPSEKERRNQTVKVNQVWLSLVVVT